MDRRSRLAASIVALAAAVSAWLSAGTIAVLGGDTHRIAALPSLWILIGLAIAAVLAAHLAKLRVEEAWPLLITVLLWLPFLPLAIPSAFLIWQGPTEAFVWLIAVSGVIAARPPKVMPIAINPDRAPWIAGALVAIAAFVAFSQVRGVIPGGDEPHYLAATQSILKDFDLRVANNYENGDYLDYFPGRLEPHFLKRSTSGDIYSIHAPGVSVVVLPAFAAAGYVGAVLTIILIAALAAAITWRMAWRVSGSVAGAWVGTAAVFATPPYFFHAFTIYPEIIGSLCVACGVWLLIELADLRDVAPRSLIGTGAALALLPWLHSRFAVIAGALGLVIVVRLAERREAITRIARFLAVPVIAGVAWFAFFWVIWGTPNPIAPYGADTSTSSAYILRGLIGLLVDQQFGLVTTAPIYLAGLAGVVVFARRRPRLAAELLLVVVPYAIAVASYAMWWAGSAAPARFLIAVLPLAALPIAMVFAEQPARRSLGEGGAKVALLVLLLVSIALIFPRTFVESGRFIYNNRGAMDATLEWLSQSVNLSLAFPSVHRDGGSAAIRDAAVWLALVTAAVVLIARSGKRSIGLKWTTAAAALGIAIMVASSVVWSWRETSVETPDRAKLAALAAYRPAWHTVLVDLSASEAIPSAAFLESMWFDVWPGQRVNRLPAGDYTITANPGAIGPVRMLVGRNDPSIESPQADDLRDGRSGFRLRLPITLQSLHFNAGGQAPQAAPFVRVTPGDVRRPLAGRNATRAARYGHARAFFFDERAYPERDGFWTRANGLALVVIDTDDGTRVPGLPISITAGAVPTTVTLSVGIWQETFALEAGQKQDVTLPPATDGAWPLWIRSGPGFRPSEREPGNRDVRSLAAWIAIH